MRFSPVLPLLAGVLGLASAQAQCPPLSLTPTALPSAMQGTAYPAQTFVAAGGPEPISYSLIGDLPPGLVFQNGVLAGTAAIPGTFPITVTATDANGCSVSRAYALSVSPQTFFRDLVTVTSGNGIIEPGECNSLNIQLANRGRNPSSPMLATLTSETPGVSIVQGTSAYPPAAVNGLVTNLQPFVVATDSTVPCFSQIVFRLSVQSELGTFVLNFNIPVGQMSSNYVIVPNGQAALPPGELIAGSQTDDALVPVVLPFGVNLYGQHYPAGTVVQASTNGNVQFGFPGSSVFPNSQLPALAAFGASSLPITQPTLFPYWDDLQLADPASGIFTSVTGPDGQRVFTIEWRGTRFDDPTARVNFALQFTEGSAAFDFVYRNGPGANGNSATIGAQATAQGPLFTSYSFNSAGRFQDGLRLTATLPAGVCQPGTGVCLVAPLFTSAPPPLVTIGAPYTHTFTATGSPLPTFELASGTLPPGLSLTPQGVLSGTASASFAPRSLTVRAVNGVEPAASQTFTLRPVGR